MPAALQTELAAAGAAAPGASGSGAGAGDTARFGFRYKKSILGRKQQRKNERLAKKQRAVEHRKRAQQPAAKPPAPTEKTEMMARAAANAEAVLAKKKSKAATGNGAAAAAAAAVAGGKLPAAGAEDDRAREERQLRKLAERNPDLFRRLQDQNLVPRGIRVADASPASATASLDNDEKNIQMYSKLLRLKKGGGINQSFKRDGLDFLLEGISGDASGGDDDDDDDDDDMGRSFGSRRRKEDTDEDDEDDADDHEINGSLSEDDELGDSDEDDEMLDLDDDDDDDDEDEDDERDDDEDYDDSSEDDNSQEDEQIDGMAQSGDDGPLADSHEPLSEAAAVPQPALAVGKYVPPHLRGQPATKSEQYIRLKRQIQGLLNRLSDANLESIVAGLEDAFRANSRHDVTEIITDIMLGYVGDMASILDSFIATYASLIAALYNVIGLEFGAHFVQTMSEQFDSARSKYLADHETDSEEINKRCTNFATLLAMLYNFGVVSCVLIYDIVRMSIASLSELDVEVLLRLLKLSGHQLRSDDPTALKDIVMRVKFMVETIMDIKNNKRKSNDQKAAAQLQQERIKKVLANIIKKRSLFGTEPLRVSIDDIRSIKTKGKWWLVGAAWVGNQVGADSSAAASSAGTGKSKSAEQSASQELLELARKHKMNTDVRRSIFVVLMSSEDCLDAFERLLRLNLKDKQERDIVRVLIHCCVHEKVYNPYYALVASQFCNHAHAFKITFQYALWDALKTMAGSDVDDGDDDPMGDGYAGKHGLRRIANLARLMVHLFSTDSLPLSALKASNFASLSELQILFFRLVLIGMCTQPAPAKASNPDGHFQKPFVRLKAQPELLSLREGLILFIQAHISPQLKAGKLSVLGVSENDVDTVKRRIKLVKQILS
nr:suppressor of glycerol defect [Polyrhizophydium stewartii]